MQIQGFGYSNMPSQQQINQATNNMYSNNMYNKMYSNMTNHTSVNYMSPANTLYSPANVAYSMRASNMVNQAGLSNMPQPTPYPINMNTSMYNNNYNNGMGVIQPEQQKNSYPVEEIEKMYPEVYYKIYPKVCRYCDMFKYNYGFRFIPNKEQFEAICDEIYNELEKELSINNKVMNDNSGTQVKAEALEEKNKELDEETKDIQTREIENSDNPMVDSEDAIPVIRTTDARRDFDRGDRAYDRNRSRTDRRDIIDRRDRRELRDRRRYDDRYYGNYGDYDLLDSLIKILLINRLIKNY